MSRIAVRRIALAVLLASIGLVACGGASSTKQSDEKRQACDAARAYKASYAQGGSGIRSDAMDALTQLVSLSSAAGNDTMVSGASRALTLLREMDPYSGGRGDMQAIADDYYASLNSVFAECGIAKV